MPSSDGLNSGEKTRIDAEAFDAVLLDLDGVVTETAKVHAASWKTMFDAYLKQRADRLGVAFEPFDAGREYREFVDGKPRYDGVASFLHARGIDLPRGDIGDPPEKETLCGLGNRKNRLFLEAIRRDGVKVYRSSVAFIERAKALGLKVAVVTASRNGAEVVKAAGLADLFDARVDGVVAHERKLAGKPAPDTFLEAARLLGVDPARAAMIEDAAAGVEAGAAGGFGLVIGVCRDGRPGLLRDHGAGVVISDLGDLELCGKAAEAPAPPAMENMPEIAGRIAGSRLAVFLDYDGTLTPIVERPELAVLPAPMRRTLTALSGLCTVCLISGRGLEDLQRMVGLDGPTYAGAHGFDIAGPQGTEMRHRVGADHLSAIAAAAKDLRARLAPIDGALVEDKTYALAVHYRMVAPGEVDTVARAVDDVLARYPGLRKTGGKKVFELRPDIDWDKGKAVLWLLDALDLDAPDVLPIYIGDDVTDRDAFRALRGRGISLLVAEDDQPTCADYRLSDPAEVGRFLDAVVGFLRKGNQ